MTTIELFCCAGGMSEGFRRAGLPIDLAVDCDPDMITAYEANHGYRPMQCDVYQLAEHTTDLLHAIRLAELGPIDLLVADPPCTPWSPAGKRKGLADPRDCLRVTRQLIEKLRPRAWLIGNVPGLQYAPSWPIAQEIFGTIEGYEVDHVSLDAACYGVPQHRIRPFWFGRPRGSSAIRWPEPAHCDPSELESSLGLHALKPWVTCRQALAVLPREKWGREVTLSRNGVVLSMEARAILQGFPLDWVWVGNKTQQAAQVGMAMPPPLAEAVARSVRAWLERNRG